MSLDLRRHVRVKYAFQVVGDQLDNLLAVDSHTRHTLLVVHVPITGSPSA